MTLPKINIRVPKFNFMWWLAYYWGLPLLLGVFTNRVKVWAFHAALHVLYLAVITYKYSRGSYVREVTASITGSRAIAESSEREGIAVCTLFFAACGLVPGIGLLSIAAAGLLVAIAEINYSHNKAHNDRRLQERSRY